MKESVSVVLDELYARRSAESATLSERQVRDQLKKKLGVREGTEVADFLLGKEDNVAVPQMVEGPG